MTTKVVRASGDLQEGLEREAISRNISFSALVRNILNQWLMDNHWKKTGRRRKP